MRSELLGRVGTSINNIIRNNKKYPHGFHSVLLLYQIIATKVTQQQFLMDTIKFFHQEV